MSHSVKAFIVWAVCVVFCGVTWTAFTLIVRAIYRAVVG